MLLTERVCPILAGLTNALLLYLTIKKSPESFGIYKHLSTFIYLFQMLYALMDALIAPSLHTDESYFFVVVDSRKALIPNQFLLLFNAIFCALFGVSVANCNFLFIFRYLIISGRCQKWIQNKPYIIIFWTSFPIIFGIMWGFTCWFFCGPSDVNDRYLQDRILIQTGARLDQIAYTGPNFYPIENGTCFYNWRNLTGVLVQTLLTFISSFLMIFFGYKCYHSITQLTSLTTSPNNRSLQRQLFFALVFQSAIPIGLMHIPAGLVCLTAFFLTAFFNSSSPIFGEILSVTVALYPVIDPLPNIMIIGEYRKAVLRCLRCGKRNHYVAPTSAS